jgi:light-regulated signal transduction histidine kinase (bacteriophytochrome)
MIKMSANSISYSLNDIALVVKRHTHDVRNALNGMELELALLSDSATDPATREAVRRLREAGVEIGRLMQGLSAKYGTEESSAVPVVQIAERWNADAHQVATGVSLEWNIRLGSEMVCIESGLVRSLLKDVLEMAVRIGSKRSLQIDCHCEDGQAFFEISAKDCNAGIGIINSQQTYWEALRRLAERNHGLMTPATLSSTGSFPMRLSLPLHRSAT